MLNTNKILKLCDCSFDTDFLQDHLSCEQFSDFNDLITYLKGDDNRYIQDRVSEYADSSTSIYYYDIEEYTKNNIDRVNNAISEFGWEGCGKDLHKAGQIAEYCEIQENVYQDIERFIEYLEETYQF